MAPPPPPPPPPSLGEDDVPAALRNDESKRDKKLKIQEIIERTTARGSKCDTPIRISFSGPTSTTSTTSTASTPASFFATTTAVASFSSSSSSSSASSASVPNTPSTPFTPGAAPGSKKRERQRLRQQKRHPRGRITVETGAAASATPPAASGSGSEKAVSGGSTNSGSGDEDDGPLTFSVTGSADTSSALATLSASAHTSFPTDSTFFLLPASSSSSSSSSPSLPSSSSCADFCVANTDTATTAKKKMPAHHQHNIVHTGAVIADTVPDSATAQGGSCDGGGGGSGDFVASTGYVPDDNTTHTEGDASTSLPPQEEVNAEEEEEEAARIAHDTPPGQLICSTSPDGGEETDPATGLTYSPPGPEGVYRYDRRELLYLRDSPLVDLLTPAIEAEPNLKLLLNLARKTKQAGAASGASYYHPGQHHQQQQQQQQQHHQQQQQQQSSFHSSLGSTFSGSRIITESGEFSAGGPGSAYPSSTSGLNATATSTFGWRSVGGSTASSSANNTPAVTTSDPNATLSPTYAPARGARQNKAAGDFSFWRSGAPSNKDLSEGKRKPQTPGDHDEDDSAVPEWMMDDNANMRHSSTSALSTDPSSSSSRFLNQQQGRLRPGTYVPGSRSGNATTEDPIAEYKLRMRAAAKSETDWKQQQQQQAELQRQSSSNVDQDFSAATSSAYGVPPGLAPPGNFGQFGAQQQGAQRASLRQIVADMQQQQQQQQQQHQQSMPPGLLPPPGLNASRDFRLNYADGARAYAASQQQRPYGSQQQISQDGYGAGASSFESHQGTSEQRESLDAVLQRVQENYRQHLAVHGVSLGTTLNKAPGGPTAMNVSANPQHSSADMSMLLHRLSNIGMAPSTRNDAESLQTGLLGTISSADDLPSLLKRQLQHQQQQQHQHQQEGFMPTTEQQQQQQQEYYRNYRTFEQKNLSASQQLLQLRRQAESQMEGNANGEESRSWITLPRVVDYNGEGIEDDTKFLGALMSEESGRMISGGSTDANQNMEGTEQQQVYNTQQQQQDHPKYQQNKNRKTSKSAQQSKHQDHHQQLQQQQQQQQQQQRQRHNAQQQQQQVGVSSSTMVPFSVVGTLGQQKSAKQKPSNENEGAGWSYVLHKIGGPKGGHERAQSGSAPTTTPKHTPVASAMPPQQQQQQPQHPSKRNRNQNQQQQQQQQNQQVDRGVPEGASQSVDSHGLLLKQIQSRDESNNEQPQLRDPLAWVQQMQQEKDKEDPQEQQQQQQQPGSTPSQGGAQRGGGKDKRKNSSSAGSGGPYKGGRRVSQHSKQLR